MKYRREIDGLRALAVLPVIAFHAGSGLVPGGFVGVDVFFVISGYLITGILLEDLRRGQFSLANFYERRARRILPALFLVVAACIPFAWFWLLPADMAAFARSVGAVSLFASNFLFWIESGYFETAAEFKPLLHTWSLAVEEQFYILFPLLLFAVWRWLGKSTVWVLGALLLLGLALSHWSVRDHPGAAFFLIHARAWELVAGALVAWHMASRERPLVHAGRAPQFLSLAGIALIAFAVFTFDRNTPFPGLHALVPVAGTVLIILFAWPGTIAASLLGSRVLVGVGLVSYSAYLWHQPLFAFARHRSFGEPEVATFAALSMLSLGLAWLSWKFVETPFRQRERVSRVGVVRFALAGSVALLAFGVAGHLSGGNFGRTQTMAEMRQLDERLETNFGLRRGCSARETLPADCATAERPDLMVWGDSYAMHLLPGLQASWKGAGIVQLTSSKCAPVIGQAPMEPDDTVEEALECIAHNDTALDFIEANPSIRFVVMSASLDRHVGDGKVMLRDGRILPGRVVAERNFRETIARLDALGVIPVVFSHPPRDGKDIGRCLVAATLSAEPASVCDIALDDEREYSAEARAFLQRSAESVRVVWLEEGLCADGACFAQIDDTFIYRDSGHLSHEGSALLGERMDFAGRILAAGRQSPEAPIKAGDRAP